VQDATDILINGERDDSLLRYRRPNINKILILLESV